MLKNIIYIGHLAQLQETTVSYKNHTRCAKDRSDWCIIYNNHEPIISQELWDKVREREKSVAQGRKTKTGYVHPLSGFLVCADCGDKLKMSSHAYKNGKYHYHFDCGLHIRYGKTLCFSHFIPARVLEDIVLEDIRSKAKYIMLDEKAVREDFLRYYAELTDSAVKVAKRELKTKQKRYEELSRLVQSAYEDKVRGKIPEALCIGFIEKYSAEQTTLKDDIVALEEKLLQSETTTQNVDDFIRNIKKYIDAPELTREMCYDLIDRVIVGGLPKITGKDRTIEIVYKVDFVSALRYKLQK